MKKLAEKGSTHTPKLKLLMLSPATDIIVSEYCGMSLQNYIERFGSLNESVLLYVLRETLEALQ